MASGKAAHERYVVEGLADPASPYARLVAGVRGVGDTVSPVAGAPVLSALPVQPGAPPHPWLDMLSRTSIEGLVLPTARVAAHGADWILCPTPVHPPAGQEGGLDEQTLMNRVLRPAAAVLRRMEGEQLTHRSIRPENIFVSGRGLQLGPFWLAPPAFLQPAIYETPVVASCVRQGRGRGTIADDIYALGVSILALFLGETPMDGVPESEIIERKLWQGSYAALTEGRRIPFGLGEIIAAMVSDQPSQRPTPDRLCRASALSGPATSSRKRVNAAIPMVLAGREVWNAPQLAFLIGEEPEAVATALQVGQIDAWLRRGLNEVVLAERLETVVHPGGIRVFDGRLRELEPVARTSLLSKVARMLDPEAPIVWDRLRLMPEGLGGVLAACGSDPLVPQASVNALLATEILIARAMDEPPGPRRELALAAARRAMSAARNQAALIKLSYELNPSMACASPSLARHPVASLANVLPALEQASDGVDGGTVLDHHLLGFIAIRRSAAGMKPVRSGDALADLRLLSALRTDFKLGAMPNLARRFAAPIVAASDAWPGTSRREARREAFEQAVSAGDLDGLLALAADREGLARDQAAQAAAHERIRTLRKVRDASVAADRQRESAALRFGREGVAVVGAAACAIALLLQVVP